MTARHAPPLSDARLDAVRARHANIPQDPLPFDDQEGVSPMTAQPADQPNLVAAGAPPTQWGCMECGATGTGDGWRQHEGGTCPDPTPAPPTHVALGSGHAVIGPDGRYLHDVSPQYLAILTAERDSARAERDAAVEALRLATLADMAFKRYHLVAVRAADPGPFPFVGGHVDVVNPQPVAPPSADVQ